MDRARHLRAGITVKVPAGTFTDCVFVHETTPLDPEEKSINVYSSNVGLIVSGNLDLVEYSFAER